MHKYRLYSKGNWALAIAKFTNMIIMDKDTVDGLIRIECTSRNMLNSIPKMASAANEADAIEKCETHTEDEDFAVYVYLGEA